MGVLEIGKWLNGRIGRGTVCTNSVKQHIDNNVQAEICCSDHTNLSSTGMDGSTILMHMAGYRECRTKFEALQKVG